MIRPPHSKREDIPSLTGLRFFAAFAIVVHHLLLSAFATLPAGVGRHVLMRLGFLGMSLFFVLSGFIIHYNYFALVRDGNRKNIYNFFVARFARLYPLFILFVLLDLLLGRFAWERLLALPFFVTLTQSWLYFLLGDVPVTLPFALSNITWSISTEWFLYALFPLLALALCAVRRWRAKVALVAGTMVAFVAMRWVLIDHGGALESFALSVFGPRATSAGNADVFTFQTWLVFNSPYCRLFEFGIGLAISHLYLDSRSHQGPAARSWYYAALGGLGLAGIGFSLLPTRPDGIAHRLWEYVQFTPYIGLVILGVVSGHGLLRRVFAWAPFVWLGERSYSIYLLHIVVLSRVHASAPTPSGYLKNWIKAVVAVAIVLGLSACSYAWVEVPARVWLRKRLSKT